MLRELIATRSPLTALVAMHRELGDVYQIGAPGFEPIVLVGPKHNRRFLVDEREHLRWRNPSDPVAKLLRRGILVVDDEEHDRYRAMMEPVLQRKHITQHIPAMWEYTDFIVDQWPDGGEVEMLVEMRKLALLILMGTLFGVEFKPDLDALWKPILRMLAYISPGLWLVMPNAPRLGYQDAIDAVDAYLYRIIRERRADAKGTDDLLGQLIAQSDMTDDLIRDQLLTMLIAGHDTSTALFAWALWVFGTYPDVLATARDEIAALPTERPPTDAELRKLTYLDHVIHETLRLYPPIHVGNRIAKHDIPVGDHCIPEGQRVMLSIFTTHRDAEQWASPDEFCPAHFDRTQHKRPAPLTYIPFGGGPRNCIGASFALVEARTVLARILQRVDLELLTQNAHIHMGATLEPRPGVRMRVSRRI